MSLTGKVAVVTGAANDIGVAVVQVLAERGARVLAVDDDLAALSTLAGDYVAIFAADVTRSEDVIAYVSRAVELWGGIDLFFNNVDVDGPESTLWDYPDTAFEEIVVANVRTAFLGLKHVVPQIRDGGAVVNLASALGVVGAAGRAGYVAAKHAVLGLTKVAALECEPRGIRVNAVCPDPAARRSGGPSAGRGPTVLIPPKGEILNEYETPDDVAQLVAFLFSDAGPVHHRAGAFAEIRLPTADEFVAGT
jgi:NAD(P)-dependent dehydrogenase (short-subunit alcohol dehydrogenase family)